MMDQAAQKLKNQKQYKKKRQGDITIHFQDDKPDKNKNKFGEYVDYEEIKD